MLQQHSRPDFLPPEDDVGYPASGRAVAIAAFAILVGLLILAVSLIAGVVNR